MINKIIDGISAAINSEFGDSYEIYTESVRQGLKEPCFSVLCLNPTMDQVLGNRYFKTHQFVIHYFPKSKEPRSDCQAVSERLINALELITAGGNTIRGTGMHSEIDNDILHFFVNYDLYVYKEKESTPFMESMKHSTDVKG